MPSASAARATRKHSVNPPIMARSGWMSAHSPSNMKGPASAIPCRCSPQRDCAARARGQPAVAGYIQRRQRLFHKECAMIRRHSHHPNGGLRTTFLIGVEHKTDVVPDGVPRRSNDRRVPGQTRHARLHCFDTTIDIVSSLVSCLIGALDGIDPTAAVDRYGARRAPHGDADGDVQRLGIEIPHGDVDRRQSDEIGTPAGAIQRGTHSAGKGFRVRQFTPIGEFGQNLRAAARAISPRAPRT